MPTALQNCPPIPSPTAVQSLTVGLGAVSGSITLDVGGFPIGPLSFGFSLQDIQAILNVSFPGSVISGVAPTLTTAGTVFFNFQEDPGVLATISSNTLATSVPAPVLASVAGQPATIFPHYDYLTSLWSDFVVPTAKIPAFEMSLIRVKGFAQRYVTPTNWGNTYPYAVFLVMAHLLFLAKNEGKLTHYSALSVSKSFWTPPGDNHWNQSRYGVEFVNLRRHSILPIGYVGPSGGASGWPAPLQGGFEGGHSGDFQPIN